MLVKILVTLLILVTGALLMSGIAIYQNQLPLLSTPGVLERLRIYLTSNVAETAAEPRLPELEIRSYSGDPEYLLDLSRQAIQSLDWELVSYDANSREIHAIARTPLWSFRDDVLVRIRPGDNDDQSVYVRSSSRLGRGDLGKNSQNILDFYRAVEQRL